MILSYEIYKKSHGQDLSGTRPFNPSIDPRLIKQLGELRFLGEKENILLLGPPGVGKTHVAISLGVAACQARHKTYFTTLEEMMRRLSTAPQMDSPGGSVATQQRLF
ncbi:MAG TPA: hypothetical protein ENI11_00205 [Actinobacteria bacterium]|nr:hypothetical protein [Actinomycetota bacterium]